MKTHIEEPGTVFVGWEELVRYLSEYGISRRQAYRLKEAGLIRGMRFGPGVRPMYRWQQVQKRLGLEDCD